MKIKIDGLCMDYNKNYGIYHIYVYSSIIDKFKQVVCLKDKEIADKLFYRYSGILFKRKRLSEYTLKEKKDKRKIDSY